MHLGIPQTRQQDKHSFSADIRCRYKRACFPGVQISPDYYRAGSVFLSPQNMWAPLLEDNRIWVSFQYDKEFVIRKLKIYWKKSATTIKSIR